MMQYRFIKISDNRNPEHFVIDITRMKDIRIRTSILYSKHLDYLDGLGNWREVFDILEKYYSSYCCYRCELESYQEAVKMQQELLKYQIATASATKAFYVALAKLDYLTSKTE